MAPSSSPPATLAAQAEYVWDVLRLYRAGVVVRDGALFRISSIHDRSRHRGLRRLCVRVCEEIGGVRLAPIAEMEVANA